RRRPTRWAWARGRRAGRWRTTTSEKGAIDPPPSAPPHLATLADAPIATLEAHPLPTELKRAGGVSLHAASPLATHLSQPVAQTVRSGSPPAAVAESGETLYRTVVPAKVAAQVGKGLVTPLSSKAV